MRLFIATLILLAGCCDMNGQRIETTDTFSGSVVQSFTCPGSSATLTVTSPATSIMTESFSTDPGNRIVTLPICSGVTLQPSVSGDTWSLASGATSAESSCQQQTDDGQLVQVTGFGGTMTLAGSSLQLHLTETATIGSNTGCVGQLSGTVTQQPALEHRVTEPLCQPG